MIKKLIISILPLFFVYNIALAAEAPSLKEVFRTESAIQYIDENSVIEDGDNISVIRVTKLSDGRSTSVQAVLDRRAMKYYLLNSNSYDKNGKLVKRGIAVYEYPILPDDPSEKMWNMVLEKLGYRPILGSKKHTWKLIWKGRPELGEDWDYYILTDAKFKAVRPANAPAYIVYIRCKWKDPNKKGYFIPSIYTVDRNMKLVEQGRELGPLGMVYMEMLYREKGARTNVQPGTLEEAIYNATISMWGNK